MIICCRYIEMSSTNTDVVEVSLERLRALEKMESELPTMIDHALKEYKANALKRLHEKDKLDPVAVNLRARRYAQKNREVLNAKRREKRRLEKAAREAQAKENNIVIVKHEPSAFSTPAASVMTSLGQAAAATAREVGTHPRPISENGRTVRFND